MKRKNKEVENYIRWLRQKVGKELVLVNYVTACITNEKGEILLQKRSRDEERWGFPGGIIERRESAEEALRREVREETGLEVKIEHLIGVYTKYFGTVPNGDESQLICLFFKCSPTGGELRKDGIETFDLRYFPRGKVPRLFSRLHQDKLDDFLNGRIGVYR